MASRPTDPTAVLAALLRADAADPALVPSLTREQVAAATGRTPRQVAKAVQRQYLRFTPGSSDGHACNLYAPAEVARWVREGSVVPTD